MRACPPRPWHRPCSYRRMRSSLDNYLGIHPQALELEAKRNELLAANLANVDTPNYKARDIDFKTALATASGDSTSSSTATALRTSGQSTSSGGPTASNTSTNNLSTSSEGGIDSSA